eukprot:scaffold269129_cov33-Prasinocladus_malaysianus.AAC.1
MNTHYGYGLYTHTLRNKWKDNHRAAILKPRGNKIGWPRTRSPHVYPLCDITYLKSSRLFNT